MLIVLKYGGNAMALPGADDPLLDDVAARVRAGDRVVLLHGGGPQIDAELSERGIGQERVAGLRVTDAATLAVAERVLCGTVNKALVRALSQRGVRAVGVSGQDGGLLVAEPLLVHGRSLGFVGTIVAVDTALVRALLDAGFVPVVAPVAATPDGTTALNVNADTAAGSLAGALRADAYVVVTNVAAVRRVRDDPATAIDRLAAEEARRLLDAGVFDGGMQPKMESALEALARGARAVVVAGQGTGALSRALSGGGTTIEAT